MDIIEELENTLENNEPRRNTRIIDLVEGDVLVDGDEISHVSEGEISVYADGTIDESRGTVALIDKEALVHAIVAGATIFNMEEVKG